MTTQKTRNRPRRDRANTTGPGNPREHPDRLFYTTLNGPRGLVAQGDAIGLKECISKARDDGTLTSNHLRTALQSACKAGNADIARICLEEGAPTDLLKENQGSPALYWAVSKGHLDVVRLLISNDYAGCPANVEWRDENRRPIWFQAALNGHLEVLRLLLKRVVHFDVIDTEGRTIFHNLAHDAGVASNQPAHSESGPQQTAPAPRLTMGGQLREIPQRPSLEQSIERVPSPGRARAGSQTSMNADTDGGGLQRKRKLRPFRKILWDEHIVAALLSTRINIHVRDNDESRTALDWAAATGNSPVKLRLAEMLLEHGASVNGRSSRDKTALHLACSTKHPQPGFVKLLLRYHADVRLRSDGGWTCLHNTVNEQACPETIDILLKHSRDLLNARTTKGMTPLHVAAERGSLEAVEKLVTFPDVNLHAQDTFHMTAMLRAAQNGHSHIAHFLSPCNRLHMNRLHENAVQSCNEFQAHIVDFRPGTEVPTLVEKCSVYEAVYATEDGGDWKHTTDVRRVQPKGKAKGMPKFRWIHLPANNPTWIQALMAKAFLESGASDIEGVKSVLKAFSEQGVKAVHKAGGAAHDHTPFCSSFIRPHCQRISRGQHSGDAEPEADQSPERVRIPNGILRERPGRRGGLNNTRFSGSPDRLRQSRLREGTNSDSPSLRSDQDGERTPTQATSGKEIPRTTNGASGRQGRRSRQPSGQETRNSLQENELTPYNSLSSLPPSRSQTLPLDDPSRGSQGGVISFFMPYLHFETGQAHQELSQAVKRSAAKAAGPQRRLLHRRSLSRIRDRPSLSKDELLIDGYLQGESGLQLRRTLDQFYLRGIDTTLRDSDQVVGKHCIREGKQEKIYMVDQLWMFAVGQHLLITAFPERWNQPIEDPLNVLQGVIQEIRILSKTKLAVKSVHDLALLISRRCSGAFDRHVPGDEDYQFLEMFESEIGHYNVKHNSVYEQFYQASSSAWQVLNKRRLNGVGDEGLSLSPDQFLSIGEETEILKQVRDISEEVGILCLVLDQQAATLDQLAVALLIDIENTGRRSRETKRHVSDRIEETKNIIKRNLADLDRMRDYTHDIDEKLIALLDLKQKQANALEARFSRDQGQVVLVFTIVTIIFLPSSFLAQFFTINIAEYPKDAGNNLPLEYVLKYILGIGLGFSLFFVVLAFSLNPLRVWYRSFDLSGRWRGTIEKYRWRRFRRQEEAGQIPPGSVGGGRWGRVVEAKSMVDAWDGESLRSPMRISFGDDSRGRLRIRARGRDAELAVP